MKQKTLALLMCMLIICGGCNKFTSIEDALSVCEKKGCSEPIYKYNLCVDHFVESELALERCKTEGCSRQVYKNSLCAEHYVKWELTQGSDSTDNVTKDTTANSDNPRQEKKEDITASPEPTVTYIPNPTFTPKPTSTPKPTATPTPIVNTSLTAEDIYEMTIHSVVEVTAMSPGGTSIGTGFFSDKKGTVVTNYHVIDGCNSATITLSNGTTYIVNKVLGYSINKDIAILSTVCTSSTPLKFRTSAVKTGETVYAIGSSLGLEGSLSNGIISTASREIDGNSYIQTTAPISHGNSGGPLLDKEGYVVGITSASFVDGQNLNLAIPITEVDKISLKNPVSLEELFKPDVEWLSDWDFFYYDEMECYAFVFQLEDECNNPIKVSGMVELKITNDDGVVVYEGSGNFTEDYYENWIINDSETIDLVTFYLDPSEIDIGTTAKGTVSFVVYGDSFSFDETEIEVSNLPTEPMAVYCDDLPFVANEYSVFSNSLLASITVTEIQWEVIYGNSMYLTFRGEKTYDRDGSSGTNNCQFYWRLYDMDYYLIDSGWVYLSNLMVGDKFVEEAYSWSKIEEGKSYIIVLNEVSTN